MSQSSVSPEKELNFRACRGKYENLFETSSDGFNSIMNEIYQTIDEIIESLDLN